MVLEEEIKIYKPSSMPLKKVEQLEEGNMVYTSKGDCFRCTKDDSDAYYFTEIHPSVLVEGEIMEELTDNQLELFWKLSKNELKKYNDDRA